MRVSVGCNREPSSQIQESVAIDVPDVCARSALPENWEIGRDVGHIPVLEFRKRRSQILRPRTGYRGDDFWEHLGEEVRNVKNLQPSARRQSADPFCNS